jgi:cytochrome c oxidase cbb3-type subunit I/II
MLTIERRLQTEDRVARVYTPLELAGRDIYVSEGCYNCHSQMIRTLVPDVMRYGDYSRLGETIWDHPYQWGSKRTGPDLARVGGKYNHAWHFDHMRDPRTISTGSNMPGYPWLLEKNTDYASLSAKIRAQRLIGVPFPNWSPAEIDRLAHEQAKEIAKDLKTQGHYTDPDKEIVALIAYLQSLGKKWEPTTAATAAR